jgi:hypothetical protein
MTDTSMSTSVDMPENKLKFHNDTNGVAAVVDSPERKAATKRTYSKYNHLFAIHAKSRVSPLTRQDQTETPNFNGFRNLMALVLGTCPSDAMAYLSAKTYLVVSNLRLMIENFKKACLMQYVNLQY